MWAHAQVGGFWFSMAAIRAEPQQSCAKDQRALNVQPIRTVDGTNQNTTHKQVEVDAKSRRGAGGAGGISSRLAAALACSAPFAAICEFSSSDSLWMVLKSSSYSDRHRSISSFDARSCSSTTLMCWSIDATVREP